MIPASPAPLIAALLALGGVASDVTLPGTAGALAGTLTRPASGRGPFPAVVTLTGSGAHHRDGNRTPEHPYRPFRQIAEALSGCGVATLRLDDRVLARVTPDRHGRYRIEVRVPPAKHVAGFRRLELDFDLPPATEKQRRKWKVELKSLSVAAAGQA